MSLALAPGMVNTSRYKDVLALTYKESNLFFNSYSNLFFNSYSNLFFNSYSKLARNKEFNLAKIDVEKWANIANTRLNEIRYPASFNKGKAKIFHAMQEINNNSKTINKLNSIQNKKNIYLEVTKIKEQLELLKEKLEMQRNQIDLIKSQMKPFPTLKKVVIASEALDKLDSVVFDLTFERKERVKDDPLLSKIPIKDYASLPKAKDIANFQKVSCMLYRGGQPSKEGIKFLVKQAGVKSFINLREEHDYKELLKPWNVKYFHIPITDETPPTKEQVKEYLKILSDPENLPAYVHCWAGMGRTGAMVVVERIEKEGWNLEDALREANSYPYRGRLYQEEFLRELYKDK